MSEELTFSSSPFPALSGLKFTQVALARSQADKTEELSVSFSKSYEETLKKYHSFVVKPIFAVRPLSPPCPRCSPWTPA